MDKTPKILNQINADPRAKNSSMTVQCMQYKKGHCSYGQNCRFAHVYGHQSKMAKYNADDYNSYSVSHVPKTAPCRRFWNGEICLYGKNCRFLHDDKVTDFGKTGNRKTRLCYKWEESGSCPYGMSCFYAHGQDELRKFSSQCGVQHEVISNSRIKSATAAPRGPYCGKANVSVRDQDKEKRPFNWKRKINGIYGDWIDEMQDGENVELSCNEF